MQIILGDYVGAILGLVRDGYSWRLKILEPYRETDHSVAPRGEGNVVSIEFNLMYRWHATLSEPDTEWITNKLKGMFPGKDLGKVYSIYYNIIQRGLLLNVFRSSRRRILGMRTDMLHHQRTPRPGLSASTCPPPPSAIPTP